MIQHLRFLTSTVFVLCLSSTPIYYHNNSSQNAFQSSTVTGTACSGRRRDRRQPHCSDERARSDDELAGAEISRIPLTATRDGRCVGIVPEGFHILEGRSYEIGEFTFIMQRGVFTKLNNIGIGFGKSAPTRQIGIRGRHNGVIHARRHAKEQR